MPLFKFFGQKYFECLKIPGNLFSTSLLKSFHSLADLVEFPNQTFKNCAVAKRKGSSRMPLTAFVLVQVSVTSRNFLRKICFRVRATASTSMAPYQ